MMFATSSQRKFWTFSGETELTKLRNEANQRFIEEHGARLSDTEKQRRFLSPAEERTLCRHFEFVLREFCNKFHPPMPKCVLGTSLNYFKRFYVHNSIMNYHPRDIMLTCVYLACKVEEFYVPINQFVGNLKGNREKFADIVLGFELLLMERLHYNLTVHNPYRPLEGLLIDLKTRFPAISDPERVRVTAEEFLDQSLGNDSCLIFAPSQIALAAIMASAPQVGSGLERYITDVLLQGMAIEEVQKSLYQLNRIKHMSKMQPALPREQVQQIQKKLEKCRNPENNPDSEIYRRKLEEMIDDDEEFHTKKRTKMS